ncbi:MAG: MbnP family protein [Ferruginibacter sp.]
MKRPISLLSFLFLLVAASCTKKADPTYGITKFSFQNKVSGGPLGLNGAAYTNPAGELYTPKKLLYYISNIELLGSNGNYAEPNSYHLIDQSNSASLSFNFQAPTNTYTSIRFVLGVDSIRNVSGAQTGALDPLNAMFWTWNSGYIMFKLEGVAPVSTAPGNIFEYHIGGFKGANNVLKTITLNFPTAQSVILNENGTSEIIIENELNRFWQIPLTLKIADAPLITTPGTLAKSVADNYSDMFSVTQIINN